MLRVRINRRRLLVGASIVAAAAGMLPASANPNAVGQYHDDVGSIVVRGIDGLTYQVSFELRASTGQPTQSAVLGVSYQGCKRSGKCGYTYSYQVQLPASAFSAPSANVASVTTTFAGSRVAISWTATPSTTSPSINGTVEVLDNVLVSDPTSGGPAKLTATIFGITCGGSGTVSNYLGVFTAPTAGGPPAPAATPKQFKASKGHRPSCQS